MTVKTLCFFLGILEVPRPLSFLLSVPCPAGGQTTSLVVSLIMSISARLNRAACLCPMESERHCVQPFTVYWLCPGRTVPYSQPLLVLNCNELEINPSLLEVIATFCFTLRLDRPCPGSQGCDSTSRSKSDSKGLHRLVARRGSMS